MEQFKLILEAFNAGEIPAPEPTRARPEPIKQQALDMEAPKRTGLRVIINGVERIPGSNPKQADKFRVLADGLTAKIEAGRADRQTNTPKRLCQAMSAKREADKLERTQQALNRLAEMHEAGEVPQILRSLKSKKAVYDLMSSKCVHVPNGYHTYQSDLNEPAQDSDEARAAWQLIQGKTPEQAHAEELDRRISDLQFSKIPGYFRTPAPLIAKMLDFAEIGPAHSVLEPSAGDGAIVESIEQLGFDNLIVVYEVNHSLCEILKLRGYDARPVDFLAGADTLARNSGVLPDRFQFDRIVMNPPFEGMADIDHVRAAYDRLAPGGRLVSIMSPGPFFRKDNKAMAFRDWFWRLEPRHHEDIPAGTFKESGTGVASVLIVIDKELDA